MIREAIKTVLGKGNLSRMQMEGVFTQIMQGEATSAQIAAFITALHLKGETVDEITAAATVMRKFATPVKVTSKVILDTCGTGGSGKHTFNVSTLTALVASSLGITVAKHGNRSVSSKSGSADLLERLGVNIAAEPDIVEKCINEIGIGFLFAPTFHKAMKYAIGPRREIGIRTIFNILGPLTNPASATHQLLGVFDKALCQPLAITLGNLGLKHALVVYGFDGIDEVTTTDVTFICELKNGEIKDYTVTPDEFGLKKSSLKDLQIADAQTGLEIARDILDGKTGPIHDFVVINSAFALYAADLVPTIKQGIILSRDNLINGKAKEKLELLKKISNARNT